MPLVYRLSNNKWGDNMLTLKRAFMSAGILAVICGTTTAQDRVLRVGSEGAYPPFNVVDNNGQLQGLDVDIGDALCERMKAKCVWSAQSFDGLIPALQNGQFDMIIASHSVTEERRKVVDMVKYYDNTASFVLLKGSDKSDISPAAYEGKAIGAHGGTVHAAFLEQNYPNSELKFYPTQVDAYSDLKSGRIDAVMGDTTSLYDWVQKTGSECCELADATIGDAAIGEGVGIIIAKGSPLVGEVTEALQSIRDDGTFDKLTSAYFPFPLWKTEGQ